jgi:hypothetical protein
MGAAARSFHVENLEKWAVTKRCCAETFRAPPGIFILETHTHARILLPRKEGVAETQRKFTEGYFNRTRERLPLLLQG